MATPVFPVRRAGFPYPVCGAGNAGYVAVVALAVAPMRALLIFMAGFVAGAGLTLMWVLYEAQLQHEWR